MIDMEDLENALRSLTPKVKTIWCHPDDRRVIEIALDTIGHRQSFDVVPSWVCDKGKAFVGEPVRFFG